MRGATTASSPRRTSYVRRTLVAKMVQQGLALKTVHNHMGVLRVILQQAVRRRHLRINPAISVELPKLTQVEMNILTEVEVSRLWTAYGELETPAPDDDRNGGGYHRRSRS